jgi:hypothetical protein
VKASLAATRKTIDGFAGRRVVVVGDLILDEYLFGKPARISREAPVLILRFSERQVFLGGAANAAHNVHALGARVTPIGVVGRDGAGDEMLALFRAAGISTDGIVVESGRTTPMKTRIMAGGYQATRQQVVRLDREPPGEPQPTTEDALLERLTALGARADAIVISDYGYGSVTPRIFERIKTVARNANAVVSVDSRYQIPRFTGVTAARAARCAHAPGHAGQPWDGAARARRRDDLHSDPRHRRDRRRHRRGRHGDQHVHLGAGVRRHAAAGGHPGERRGRPRRHEARHRDGPSVGAPAGALAA